MKKVSMLAIMAIFCAMTIINCSSGGDGGSHHPPSPTYDATGDWLVQGTGESSCDCSWPDAETCTYCDEAEAELVAEMNRTWTANIVQDGDSFTVIDTYSDPPEVHSGTISGNTYTITAENSFVEDGVLVRERTVVVVTLTDADHFVGEETHTFTVDGFSGSCVVTVYLEGTRQQQTAYDATGAWNIEGTGVSTHQCDWSDPELCQVCSDVSSEMAEGFKIPFTISAVQNGNTITISDSSGSYNGTVDGDAYAFQGNQIYDDGNLKVVMDIYFRVNSDGNSLSGEVHYIHTLNGILGQCLVVVPFVGARTQSAALVLDSEYPDASANGFGFMVDDGMSIILEMTD